MSRQNRRVVSAYTLRDIDPDLWRRVKIRAAYEGKTIREALVDLLKVYATHGGDALDKFLTEDSKRR